MSPCITGIEPAETTVPAILPFKQPPIPPHLLGHRSRIALFGAGATGALLLLGLAQVRRDPEIAVQVDDWFGRLEHTEAQLAQVWTAPFTSADQVQLEGEVVFQSAEAVTQELRDCLITEDLEDLAAYLQTYAIVLERAESELGDYTETWERGLQLVGAWQESPVAAERALYAAYVERVVYPDRNSDQGASDLLAAISQILPGDSEGAEDLRVMLGSLNRATPTWGRSTEDLFEFSDQLARDHRASFLRRVRRERSATYGLIVFSLLLLGRILLYVFEMHARSKDLEAARLHLADRIDERTRELSSAKEELEAQIDVRRKAQADLQEALYSAEEGTQAKSTFLANMSHEIRTPMTAIIGFAERLVEPETSDGERAEAILTIRRNSRFLLQLINDILDLSRIENGRLRVESKTCSPTELLAETQAVMMPTAEAKQLSLSFVADTPYPGEIRTDAVRLRQILFNLIENAIKFTDVGRIEVGIEFREPTSEKSAEFWFHVRDTGPGIEETAVRRLFSPFTQLDNSLTRKKGGAGLGLTIAKGLVEALGGRLEIQATMGTGSTVSFFINPGDISDISMVQGAPRVDLRNQMEGPQMDHDWLGCSVLLVEDGRDNQRLITMILERAGALVDTATNGNIGVARALEAVECGAAYDIILMDMQMPVMDGYEATRTLRRAGYAGIIVALTAHAMTGDRARCLAAGCDDFVTKPVDLTELMRCLRALLDRKGPTVDLKLRESGGRKSPTEGLTLADLTDDIFDDPEMLELVELFVTELAGDMAAMRAALDGGDIDRLRTLAHQIKGSAGSYGFPELTERAAQVENAIRDGESSAVLRGAVESFEALSREVIEKA